MKTSEKITRGLLLLKTSILAALLLISCDPSDEGLAPDTSAEDTLDQEAVQSDLEEDFFYEDIDDLTAVALEEQSSGSGKVAGDRRLSCAAVTRTGSADEGTLRLDFGGGCDDGNGRTRRGVISVRYVGRQDRSNTTRELTFVDYYVDGIKIEGTRTVKTVTFEDGLTVTEIDVADGRITWPDGSVARRRLHRKRECHRDNNNILDRLIIYGTEDGNHRNGRGFIIEILEPLVYDRTCAASGVIIPVEGKKLIKHGERQITVDYGDGTCDNKVTITNKNGRTWDYRVAGN